MFRRFKRFLFHPLILRLLIALLAFTGVWAAGPTLQLEGPQRILIATLFASTIFLIFSGLWLRGYLHERTLKKGLNVPTKKGASVGPDSQHDLEVLGKEFEKACEELVRLRPAAGLFQRGGMYGLPWIVVLGPPGAGKTSALQQSGLRFTSLGRGVSGIAGTRNCTWWLAEEAIFLDTAGRYTIHEQDHDEWLGFLKLLRRHRSRRPIDGAMVQIGIDSLLNMEPGLLEETALQLQKRIDELIEHLEIRFPVYLVFSKCDRLDGFADYFQHLTREERIRPWGFSLDVDNLSGAQFGQAFSQAYSDLIDRLVVHMAGRIEALGTLEAREAALSFPRELRLRQDNLRTFMEILFEPSRHREMPWLRGVFLTSAVQDQMSLPGFRHSLAEQLSLPPRRSRPAPGSSFSYFLAGMFKRMIQQASKPVRLSRRARKRRWLSLGAAMAAGVLVSFVGSCEAGRTYTEQRQWLLDVSQTTKALQHSNASTPNTAKELTRRLDLQEQLERLLEEQDVDGVHDKALLALYDSVDLFWLLPRREDLNRRLERATGYNPDLEDSDTIFVDGFLALKADHILRGEPCGNLRSSGKDASEFMGRYFAEAWARDVRLTDNAEMPADIKARVTNRIRDFFADGQSSRLRLDERLRERTTDALSKTQPPRLYITLLGYEFNLLERERLIQSEWMDDPGIQELYLPDGCKQLRNSSDQVQSWMGCLLPNVTGVIAWMPEYQTLFEEAWIGWIGHLADNARWRIPANQKSDEALSTAFQLVSHLSSDTEALLPRIFRTLGGPPACPPPLPPAQGVAMDLKKRWEDWYEGDDLCKPAQVRFCASAALQSGDASSPSATNFKLYLEAMRALKKELRDLQDNKDRNGKALELVKQTMNTTGTLRGVDTARQDFFPQLQDPALWPGVTDPGRGVLFEKLEALNGTLARMEGEVYGTLVPLAAVAIQQRWLRQIHDTWQSRIRFRSGDETVDACKRIDAFIRGPLEDFLREEIEFFYAGGRLQGCNLNPFKGVVMPLDRSACLQLNSLRNLMLVCEEGGGDAPPPAAKVTNFIADDINTSVTKIKLDTGSSTWTYSTSGGKSREAQGGSGQTVLMFYGSAPGGSERYLGQLPLARSIHELVSDVLQKRRRGSINGPQLTLDVRGADLPVTTDRNTVQFILTFDQPLKKDGPPAKRKPTSDGALRAIELPSNLVRP